MGTGQDPTALNRRKARKASERRNELTMQERFQDVKDFWLKQGPTRRRQLLKVPIRRLLQGGAPTLPELSDWISANDRQRYSADAFILCVVSPKLPLIAYAVPPDA